MNQEGKILYSNGFSRAIAADMIAFIEENRMDCTWNIYSIDIWIVKDKADPQVVREESIVHAQAVEGNINNLSDKAEISKILCMCNPDRILEIEKLLKEEFPFLSIAKSSDILLEIMQKGVTKKDAVERLCSLWEIPMQSTVAFGDHYNDVEMLETVAMPFLMENAPEELRKKFPNITDSNDNEGILHALLKIGLVS